MNKILNLIGLDSQKIILENTYEAWLWCFCIILITILIRRFLAQLLIGFLFKLMNQKSNLTNQFQTRLTQPIKHLVLLVGLVFACEDINFPEVLNLEIYGFMISGILKKVFSLICIIIIIQFCNRIVDYFAEILRKKTEKTESKLDDQLIPFATDSLKIIIIILGGFLIIGNIFNVNITALAAGLGVGGIAIAMASKESLENLFGSFTIFLDQPFTVGDVVNVGQITGVVEKVGFRSTRIRTFDKSLVTVPNKKMIDVELDNLGLRPVRRSKFNIGLTYNTDANQIKNIVQEIQNMIDNHDMTNNEGRVRFMEFGASSLDIMVLFYVNSSNWDDFINTKEDINYKIMEIIKNNKSDFAFPSRSIYINNDENRPEK